MKRTVKLIGCVRGDREEEIDRRGRALTRELARGCIKGLKNLEPGGNDESKILLEG
ncbi:hypothetical protein WN51_06167 [Melipona quadrifasciata]|uniref:Uncharacterized protein n=1 Tax=Melipona quadrifasciata TaxID=166423 RepID=A0A0M8ZQL1_9HYME|nr:hypothetical protein WN51_06167 [Melipona quadrifasciata]